MKSDCFPALLLILLAIGSLAQNVEIGAPPNGTEVHATDQVLVEVVRPVRSHNPLSIGLAHKCTNNTQDTLGGSTEVAVVISFLSCVSFANSTCPPPTALLGDTLYNGPYNPQYPSPNPNHLQPHQNFTIQIPASAPNGTAQLAVTHFNLIGVGSFLSSCVSISWT